MTPDLLHFQHTRLLSLYRKLRYRFDKSLKENRFKNHSTQKQTQLVRRLEKLRMRLADLEHALKLSGAAMTLGFVLSQGEVQAQSPNPLGSEFRVNTYTTDGQVNPAIALDSAGDFVITWQDYIQDGSYSGIYAQRYNAAGVAQGSEFRVNTYTVSTQRNPAIAMDNDGDFVIAWESFDQDGSSFGIYAQRYNAAGVAQGSEFRVNTYTTNTQSLPSIAMDSDGDFVITWNDYVQDRSYYGIFAQRYNALGLAQGGEFQVNTFTTDQQLSPSIAMDSDGNFVIAWNSYSQDGDNYGIYAQRYDAAGVAQGSEFRVNTYTTNKQSFSSIAMDSDGDFVIAWNSYTQDGDSYGIYAQRYDAAGVAQGSEFRVNTYTTAHQIRSSVAMDNNGDFVISWQTYGQDGDYYGIYAKQFNAAGSPQGLEFQVNTFTTDNQGYPFIAMDRDGDFTVVWQSFSQDGSGYGVFAQRFQPGNHDPQINNQSFNINENVSASTVVGTVAASDADVSQVLSYSITAGNTGGAFAINSSTGQITVAGSLDYENIASYALTVQVTDNGTPALSSSATVTININNIVETGISHPYAGDGISVYPNPSAGLFTIKSGGLSVGKQNIRIINALGETVYNSPFTEQLNLQLLPKGVYTLMLESENGVMVKQIVIE
ncbi:MAG: cadherin domain-containing protein [Cytophagaceae bacterium]|nr:cadherin domain-containing protein [Cytophagaceae bacterium]